MDRADWAFAISLISAVISGAGLGWNVWSRFFYVRPNFRVGLTITHKVSGPLAPGQYFNITALSTGPNEGTLTALVYRSRPRRGAPIGYAFLEPVTGGGGDSLPKTLRPGEVARFDFLMKALGDPRDAKEVYFLDTFGRHHPIRRQSLAFLMSSVVGPLPAR
jgi:hypothetical protein